MSSRLRRPRRLPGSRYNVDMLRRAIGIATAIVLAILAPAVAATQEQAPNRREFTIVAKDHVFTPNRLDVTQDDLLKITLKSEDRPTSFAIDAYRIVKRAAGGLSTTFEFRADQAGTFTFYCNLTTDAGCKEMKGLLVVKPK